MGLLTACGTTTNQVVSQVHVEKVKIPEELLTLSPLEKPHVDSDIDIINAYSTLFYHYKECVINIDKIKELNQ